MKTIFKWPGGKSKIASKILSFFPEKIEHYYEPFFGSGAVFFELCKTRIRFRSAIVGDKNERLIEALRDIKSYPNLIVDRYNEVVSNYCGLTPIEQKQYYDLLVENYNCYCGSAVTFLLLRKLSYSGLYRENLKGKYNVPWNKVDKLLKLQRNELCWYSESLNSAVLHARSWEKTIVEAQCGDCVYLDPPYIELKKGSFTSYSGAFDLDEHRKMAAFMRILKARGVCVVMSNSDTEATRDIYDGFTFHEIEVSRRIGARTGGANKAKELIIT